MTKQNNEKNEHSEELHFKVHTSVVFQLGESLISDVVQAIIELVKNSYDADATFSKVIVDTEAGPGEGSKYPNAAGYILIEDDGVGMSYDTIVQGWLTISNSKKRQQKKEKKLTVLGRTPLGDKGLGRLGSQRLGYNLEIITRPEKSNVEYHVAFSWRDFQTASEFSQVPVYVHTSPAEREIGTKIIISELRDKSYWTGDAATRLQEDLSKMISPYREARNFKVVATVNGRRLDLLEFTDRVRQTAQLRYTVDFDGEEISITGKTRLDFFRPEKEEEKRQFKYLVESDGGEAFFNFLSNKPKAPIKLHKAKEAGWFVSYEQKRNLSDFSEMELIDDENTNKEVIANPGPFHAEIDSFDLGMETLERQEVFSSSSQYKDYVKTLSGIRVYRDGFGVRVDPDWLKLGQQQTTGTYYGLRPLNTIGYVALTAEHNAQLEEKTDREGFKITPYYNNFYELMREPVKFASKAQTFIRRGFNEFRKANQEKVAGIEEGTESEDIAVRIGQRLAKATAYKKNLLDVRADLEEKVKETRQALKTVDKALLQKDVNYRHHVRASEHALSSMITAQERITEIEDYLNEVSDSNVAVNILGSRFELLHDQLAEFYETSSLGLTAEALSHEIHNIADQLAYRTRQITEYLRSRELKDSKITSYIEHINTSVSGLRKQLSHLTPSLKYVREKREEINILEFFTEMIDFYQERLSKLKLEVELKKTKTKDFNLWMNKGKLVQVVDNLFLNSEYWLREEIRRKRLQHGAITVEIAKPFVRVSDDGPGIEPSVEQSLFEAFVTTKGRGKGRGLGLFIIQQLLDSEGCTISLLPKRNQHGRLHVFELDLTGALHGNEQN